MYFEDLELHSVLLQSRSLYASVNFWGDQVERESFEIVLKQNIFLDTNFSFYFSLATDWRLFYQFHWHLYHVYLEIIISQTSTGIFDIGKIYHFHRSFLPATESPILSNFSGEIVSRVPNRRMQKEFSKDSLRLELLESLYNNWTQWETWFDQKIFDQFCSELPVTSSDKENWKQREY